jgi:FlaA1/EpsC-like NDP-sugar epimerase
LGFVIAAGSQVNAFALAWRRLWVHATLDLSLVFAAWWVAFWLRFNLELPDEYAELALESTLICLISYATSLLLGRASRQIWRYIGMEELQQLVVAVFWGALLTTAFVLMLRLPNFPRAVLLIHPVLVLVFLGAARALWRSIVERGLRTESGSPLVLVGSVRDASDALRALKGSRHWHAVAIVSPVAAEQGRSINRILVEGAISDLLRVCNAHDAQAAMVASGVGSSERRDALAAVAGTSINLLTMPRPEEWIKAQTLSPRKVELEDLLGRSTVDLDAHGLSELFAGQTVMVTGAGGSIGSELCRQIARFGVSRMVLVDVSEYAIYTLEQEFRQAHPQMQGLYFTANVREYERITAIAQQYKPSVVFHAAAYKHVPLMEELNEIEALRTNVQGTLNSARAAGACGAQRFVLISTDKAVNPTNVMGASKRLAERVVQAVAREFAATQFVSVRFGNVLGSSGSVVPLFEQQIAKGGPVTVTHPDIVRYFMTIPEAARLVLQAGLMGTTGQIYVLDMGEPVKIADMARMMIRLSGKTEQEVPISYTGLRPGEKLFEELLADDESTEPTSHPKLRVAKASALQPGNGWVAIDELSTWLQQAGAAPQPRTVREWLKRMVPEYSSR